MAGQGCAGAATGPQTGRSWERHPASPAALLLVSGHQEPEEPARHPPASLLCPQPQEPEEPARHPPASLLCPRPLLDSTCGTCWPGTLGRSHRLCSRPGGDCVWPGAELRESSGWNRSLLRVPCTRMCAHTLLSSLLPSGSSKSLLTWGLSTHLSPPTHTGTQPCHPAPACTLAAGMRVFLHLLNHIRSHSSCGRQVHRRASEFLRGQRVGPSRGQTPSREDFPDPITRHPHCRPCPDTTFKRGPVRGAVCCTSRDGSALLR